MKGRSFISSAFSFTDDVSLVDWIWLASRGKKPAGKKTG